MEIDSFEFVNDVLEWFHSNLINFDCIFSIISMEMD